MDPEIGHDPAVWQVLLFILGAYLLGSIPSAYLAGRWLKGIDIRRYGTGNVGGSNVWNSVARWAIVPVAVFDIGKAVLVSWLALYVLDFGQDQLSWAVAVAAGLAAAVGHAWSIFLGFTGGRALGCILGTLLVVFPWGALILVSIIILGYIFKTTAGSTAGLLMLPPASIAFGNPAPVTWGCLAMILLTAVKRLEGNRAPLPEGKDRWPVIWRRLWHDRDLADHDEWRTRRPPPPQP